MNQKENFLLFHKFFSGILWWWWLEARQVLLSWKLVTQNLTRNMLRPTFLRCIYISRHSYLTRNGMEASCSWGDWVEYLNVTPSRKLLGRREDDDDNHNVTVRVVGNFSFQPSSYFNNLSSFNIQKMSSIFFSFIFFSLCLCIFIGNLISLFSLLVMLHLALLEWSVAVSGKMLRQTFFVSPDRQLILHEIIRRMRRKGEWNERIYQIRIYTRFTEKRN